MEMNYQELEARFPSVFGDWHIVRKLGKGSYCDVYEVCKQTGSITERKALKHISFPRDSFELQAICSELGTSDPAVVRDYIHQSVEVFEKEYQIMSDLGGQTNTVTCQDIRKIDKRDMPGYDIFFFMELLQTVANVSRERPFTEDEIAHLGIDICKALELLEKRSLIHRDIKPENLFINKNGDYKLGDFGAARLVSGVQSIVTSKGTPAYMPPEIARMMPAGPYSDIYSLGLVMYRLLNNNMPPFSEDSNSASTTSFEVASGKRLTGEKLPKPANGSKGLVSVVMKACEYEPSKRYQKAVQMREALEAVVADMEKNKETSKKAPKKAKEETSADLGSMPGNKEEDNIRRISMTQAEIDRMEEEKRLQEEREKKEREKKEVQKREECWNKIRKALIGAAVAVVVLAAAGVGVKLISDSQKKKNEYKAAITLLEGGKYDEAQAAFALIDDTYEDAAAKKKEIKDKLDEREDALNNAKSQAEEGNYAAAIKAIRNMRGQFPEDRFEELDGLVNDYQKKQAEKTAQDQQIAHYEDMLTKARAMLEQKETIPDAVAVLEELRDVYPTDSVEEAYQQALNTRAFAAGEILLENGQYEEAITVFTSLGSFDNAEDKVREAREGITINKAREELDKENYNEVQKLLNNITSSEARTLISAAETGKKNEAQFDEALACMNEAQKKLYLDDKDYENAVSDYQEAQRIFKNLGSYAKKGDPAQSRLDECENWIDYLNGKKLLDEGSYSQARKLFTDLLAVSEEGFEDSAKLIKTVDQKAKKSEAEKAYQNNDLDNAEKKYNELKALGDAENAERGLVQVNNMRKYNDAQRILDEGSRDKSIELLEQAKSAFTELGSFNDAKDKVREVGEKIAVTQASEALEQENYNDIQKLLKGIESDEAYTLIEAAETGKRNEAQFDEAVAYVNEAGKKLYLNEKDYDNAIADYQNAQRLFKDLGNYAKKGDSAKARFTECGYWMDYLKGKKLLDEGSYSQARKIFSNLEKVKEGGFEDSVKLVQTADQRAKKSEAEKAYQNNDLDGAEKKYNELKALGDTEGAERGLAQINNMRKYKEAHKLMEQGFKDKSIEVIEQAKSAFSELGSFNGARDKVQECDNDIQYLKGLQLLADKKYSDAKKIFTSLGDYLDAAKYETQAENYIEKDETYKEAKALMEYESYRDARDMFKSIKGYEDADKLADECQSHLFFDEAQTAIADGKLENARKILENLVEKEYAGAAERINDIDQYEKAKTLQDSGKYQEALDIYRSLTQFSDLQKRILDCESELKYLKAKALMKDDPATAYDLFAETVDQHADSLLLREECKNMITYQKAVAARDSGHYTEAYELFHKLDDYQDSSSQASAMMAKQQYQEAKKAADTGKYEDAVYLLENLTDNDSVSLLTDCRYKLAQQYQKDRQYEKALAQYNKVLKYKDSQKQANECKFGIYCNEMLSDGGTMDKFKERCFRVIYFYEGYSDKKGWGESIARQPKTAIETPISFATSVNNINIPMKNSEKVNALYQIMLERNMDDSAQRFVKALDNGMTMYYVISEIQKSAEFINRCSINGVEPGETVTVSESRDKNPYLTGYVYRCYQYILGRKPSTQELNTWCDYYLTEKMTISGIIRSFVNSKEFTARSLSNEDFVVNVYRAALDRGPDEKGKTYGLDYLNKGHSKQDFLEVILASKEYIQNLNKEKLKREAE